jgi:hypothetical protein
VSEGSKEGGRGRETMGGTEVGIKGGKEKELENGRGTNVERRQREWVG